MSPLLSEIRNKVSRREITSIVIIRRSLIAVLYSLKALPTDWRSTMNQRNVHGEWKMVFDNRFLRVTTTGAFNAEGTKAWLDAVKGYLY